MFIHYFLQSSSYIILIDIDIFTLDEVMKINTYRPVPPAFVSEFLPMNSYPGMEIFYIPLSLNLVSEIAMTLGISFTVNKISLRRHTFLGKLRVLQLKIEKPLVKAF